MLKMTKSKTSTKVADLDEVEEVERILEKAVKKKKSQKGKSKFKRKLKKETSEDELEVEEYDDSEVIPPKEKTEKGLPVNGRRVPNKTEKINAILDLQDKVDGYIPKSKTYYRNKTVPELEVILSDLMNSAVGQMHGAPPTPAPTSYSYVKIENETVPNKKSQRESISQGIPQQPPQDGGPAEVFAQVQAGSLMYKMHLVGAKAVEFGSFMVEDKMKGVNLEGLSQDVIDEKESLEDALGRLYAENPEVYAKYLTPINNYLLVMSSIISQRYGKNYAKKKAEMSGEVE